MFEPFKTQATLLYEADQKETTPDDTTFDGHKFFFDDEDIFLSLFNDRDDAVFNLVWQIDQHADSAEFYYFCADPSSLPALFEWFGAFGVDATSTGASLGNLVTSLASVFTKMGLIVKFHGGFWASHAQAEDLYDDADMSDIDVLIPGYRIHEILANPQTAIDCPEAYP